MNKKLRPTLVALLAGVTGVSVLANCAESHDAGPGGGEETPITLQAESELVDVSKTGVPVITFGHGAALLADGTWAEPSPELARKYHAYQVARLQNAAKPESKQKISAKLTEVASKQAKGGNEAIRADAELVEFLTTEVQPDDAAEVRRISDFLTFNSLTASPAKTAGTELGTTQMALSTNNSSTAYWNECAANGVPNPPTWGSASWTLRGNLSAPFISTNATGTIYTFTSTAPRGICIALPRIVGSRITLLGIICQGNNTNKTCFWDSNRNAVINVGTQVSIPSSSIIGGFALDANNQGVCTDCHSGENSYIIHPRESAMNVIGDTWLRPKGWAVPIVHPNWPQNRKPGKAVQRVTPPSGQGSCTSCHNKSQGRRFPLGTGLSGYCNTVAQIATSGSAAQKTMPPPNGGGNYAAHISTILNMCAPRSPATAFGGSSVWHNFFAPTGEKPRLGDFNGDGRDDIITFTFGSRADAIVALSNGTSFGAATLWHDYFGINQEQQAIGDFNGDGRDDIATFPGTGPSLVALSTGSAFTNTQNWGGHVLSGEFPIAGDFNNDRLEDIVMFAKTTDNRAYVQLSNGSSFGTATAWHNFFSPGSETPGVGDFNGDGYSDIVTFTGGSAGDVWVALSNGSSFGTASIWHGDFAYNSEIPRVGDVNGDGLDDIITFVRGSAGDVWVGLSNGSSFGPGQFWHTDMGYNSEITDVGDVDGDDRYDAVVFSQGTNAPVWVAKANN